MNPAPTKSKNMKSGLGNWGEGRGREDVRGMRSFHSLSPSIPVSSYGVGNVNFFSTIGTVIDFYQATKDFPIWEKE
jgi:hypothetical protein